MPYRVVIRDSGLDQARDDQKSKYWRGKGPVVRKRIEKAIEKLQRDPTAFGHPLKYKLDGLWSIEVYQGWRLLFKFCEECSRAGKQHVFPLDCCGSDQPCDLQLVNVLELSNHYTEL